MRLMSSCCKDSFSDDKLKVENKEYFMKLCILLYELMVTLRRLGGNPNPNSCLRRGRKCVSMRNNVLFLR